jgi:hypothetical protein
VPDPTNATAAGRARRAVLDTPPLTRPRPRRSRLLLIGLPVVAVFVAFGAIIWLAYERGVDGPPVGEPPLVRAPAVALKLPPEDDGASEGEDGEVLDMLSEAPSGQLERLLPPPEQPLPPPEQATAEEPGDPASETAELAPPAPDTAPADQPPPEVAATTPAPAETAPADEQQAAVEAEPAPPAGATPRLSDEQQTALLGEPEPPLSEPEPPASEPAPSREEAEATLDALLAEVTELNERQPPEPEPAPAETARAEPVAPRPAPADEVGPAVAPPAPQPAPTALPPLLPPGAEVTPIERERRPPTNGPAATRPGVPPPVVEPAPERTNLAALDGDYRIQLAAVREEADARRAWDLFLVDLGPVLSGLQPFIERADTANGVFYRVQIGPFASLQEAESLCDELKQRNASCFVIRR